EDRFHCTLIDTGRYLWNCLTYIDLNMIRAGVVSHPEEWEWCGYRELMGIRKRYRVLDIPRLSWKKRWLRNPVPSAKSGRIGPIMVLRSYFTPHKISAKDIYEGHI
ncbi:MAG: hypothetical protein U9N73_01600, partial [Candidatus Auribacterota bacterium]|nr:hypothetical protein [Candidatus Auribacterota bacterium]